MTYFWAAVVVVLVLGVGLIVWGSLSGPGPSGRDVSARRAVQTQVGAVMVGLSLCVLVIAYLKANSS
jgi:cell division protein FtsW (lipid II flippase)